MRTLRSTTVGGAMLAATVLFSAAAGAQNTQDPRYHPQGQQDPRTAQQRDPRYTQQDQQRRIDEERRRQSDYQRVLDQRMRAAQAQQAQLQSQQRNAQYAAQQRYLANLQAQRQQLQAQRNYNNDPYITNPYSYSYRVGNTVRQTNQYGADVLKQAVNYGYDQGVQAGRADHQDRRPSSYRNAFGYQDANYGYSGQYVAQSDYNYYFREGFRRGYTDGYGSTSQYGSFNNGSGSILGNVLTSILGLTNLR
jgi:hypothetical protein